MTLKRTGVRGPAERAYDRNIGGAVLEIKAILRRVNARRSGEPTEAERARLVELRDRITQLRKGGAT